MLCEELDDIYFYNYDIHLEKLQTNQLFVYTTYKDKIWIHPYFVLVYFDYNFPTLDIRTQLNEQLRCLDSRLECQQSQLVEIQVRKMPDIINI